MTSPDRVDQTETLVQSVSEGAAALDLGDGGALGFGVGHPPSVSSLRRSCQAAIPGPMGVNS